MTSGRPIDIFELIVANYFIGLVTANTDLYTTQFITILCSADLT